MWKLLSQTRSLSPLLLFAAALLTPIAVAADLTRDGEPALETRRERLEALDRAVRKADVRDAKRQLFDERPWARADVRSLVDLEAALAAESPAEMRRRGAAFLRQAADDGRDSFEIELARLPTKRIYSLARHVGCADADLRACIMERYRADAEALLATDLATLTAAEDDAVAAWLAELRDSLQPSIKTRGRGRRKALTLPAYPAVNAWRKAHSKREYEGPQPIEFEHYRVYAPDRTPRGDADLNLLARYAPVLVQETNPDAAYPAEDDRIGALTLAADGNRPVAAVDVASPVSYAYVHTLPLDGRDATQLVYTYWYPEHPKLKPIDPGAGRIEGITLRVTLGPHGRPRLYETIYNCGCSHRLFVDTELERQAASEFGPPQGDRPFSVQRDLESQIDLVVPELVAYQPDRPLVFFVRAGFHLPASVKYDPPETIELDGAESYTLRAYRDLERLPHDGQWASVFDENGLVRGASRTLEEILLTPLGIYRAGHPRQRGTQLIHFDQADFDDPRLFETYLRLPPSFYGDPPMSNRAAAR